MTASPHVDDEVLRRTASRCKERGIVIPTFAEMREPALVPDAIRSRLRDVGMQDADPVNLFRISWRNEPVASGGLYNEGNWIEFPSSLTGVDARIIGLVGKWFPTGTHKVGAAFGCLVPRLVTGQFDPETHTAVWPSTGNFCRGGAFDCALLGCKAIGILPEEMSPERFAWLRDIGAEVIATPGCESNVKEIYDKCWEIRRTREDCVIFNQFEELGNPIWHYHVTGTAVQQTFAQVAGDGDRLAAWVSATGSAGTIAAGDVLRTIHPHLRVVATEALQCPTLYQCGFGGHRIEGIGDKHVPWVHNVRNTDVVAAIDDDQSNQLTELSGQLQSIAYEAGWVEARRRFYRSFYSIGNTPRVVSTIMQFRAEVTRYTTELTNIQPHTHEALLDRVRLRDPDLAAAWLETHLREVAQGLREQVTALQTQQTTSSITEESGSSRNERGGFDAQAE